MAENSKASKSRDYRWTGSGAVPGDVESGWFLRRGLVAADYWRCEHVDRDRSL